MFRSSTRTKPIIYLKLAFRGSRTQQSRFLTVLQRGLGSPRFQGVRKFPVKRSRSVLTLSSPPCCATYPGPFLRSFVEYCNGPCSPRASSCRQRPFATSIDRKGGSPVCGTRSCRAGIPRGTVVQCVLRCAGPKSVIFSKFYKAKVANITTRLYKSQSAVSSLNCRIETGNRVLRRVMSRGGEGD